MSRQCRVSAGIVIWRQNSGAIAVEWTGGIAVFYACFTGAMAGFEQSSNDEISRDREISKKMAASMENKSEKLLRTF